jgi:hypothetical protein
VKRVSTIVPRREKQRTRGMLVGSSCRAQSMGRSRSGRFVKEITQRPSIFQEPIRGSGTFAKSSRIREMPRYRLLRRVSSYRQSLKVLDRGPPFMTYSRSRYPRSGRLSSRSWRKNGERVSPCSHVQQRRPCQMIWCHHDSCSIAVNYTLIFSTSASKETPEQQLTY